MLAHIGAFPNKCTIKHPFHTTATWKVRKFRKTKLHHSVLSGKKLTFWQYYITQNHALQWHLTQSGWNNQFVLGTTPFCHMRCLGMHTNVKLCFMVQALQDPPLCSSTDFTMYVIVKQIICESKGGINIQNFTVFDNLLGWLDLGLHETTALPHLLLSITKTIRIFLRIRDIFLCFCFCFVPGWDAYVAPRESYTLVHLNHGRNIYYTLLKTDFYLYNILDGKSYKRNCTFIHSLYTVYFLVKKEKTLISSFMTLQPSQKPKPAVFSRTNMNEFIFPTIYMLRLWILGK